VAEFEDFFIEIHPPEDPWDSHVNPTEWKTSILAVLTKISKTKAGMALLRSIQSGGKWILVEKLMWQECNAHGSGFVAVRGGRTFGGIVKFDPQVYMRPNACFAAKHRADPAATRGTLPDEVMFHELIHAHRHALGLAHPTALGRGLYRYHNEEEFLAVVMTNIYISDETNPRSSGLRADHTGHGRLNANLSTSLTFYKSSPQVLPLIKKFAEEQKFLFDELAKVKAKFNPFAALRECERALAQLARSKLANQREVVGTVAQIAEIAGSAGGDIARGFATPLGLGPSPKPPPDLGELAKSTLGPLAQEALRVLQR
jgi:hypothetical protein